MITDKKGNITEFPFDTLGFSMFGCWNFKIHEKGEFIDDLKFSSIDYDSKIFIQDKDLCAFTKESGQNKLKFKNIYTEDGELLSVMAYLPHLNPTENKVLEIFEIIKNKILEETECFYIKECSNFVCPFESTMVEHDFYKEGFYPLYYKLNQEECLVNDIIHNHRGMVVLRKKLLGDKVLVKSRRTRGYEIGKEFPSDFVELTNFLVESTIDGRIQKVYDTFKKEVYDDKHHYRSVKYYFDLTKCKEFIYSDDGIIQSCNEYKLDLLNIEKKEKYMDLIRIFH